MAIQIFEMYFFYILSIKFINKIFNSMYLYYILNLLKYLKSFNSIIRNDNNITLILY